MGGMACIGGSWGRGSGRVGCRILIYWCSGIFTRREIYLLEVPATSSIQFGVLLDVLSEG